MGEIRRLHLDIVFIPFGGKFRAACKVGGKTIYSEGCEDEVSAARSLFRGLSADGAFAAETSLALDIAIMGEDIQALLGNGNG